MGERTERETSAELNPHTWLDQHGDFLYRYALARLGRAEAAEDLVQETFLAALRGRQQFQGNSSERTWLVGILKHKIIDQLRRQHREQPVSDLGADAADSELFDSKGHWKKMPRAWNAPDANLENAEFWTAFGRCLSKLPGRLAQAFSLREIDDLASREICETLAVTPGHLSVLLHRARLGLWRCLSANWFANEEQHS